MTDTSPRLGQPSERTSRTVWFTAPRKAELKEEPVTAPGDTEILVRGLVSLVSAGTEMNVFRGDVSSREELGLPTKRGGFPFPITYAYQIVGEVVEAGPGSGYVVGDRVFCAHPHQDYFVIAVPEGPNADRSLVYKIPPTLDPRRAVFTNLLSVAYNALLDVAVCIGDVVAISGLGVIGHFAAHLVRPIASRVILIDPLSERRERAAWLNADAIVHPSDAVDAIRALSEARGADVFIEASGSPAALQGAIDATGVEGTIGVLSYYGRREAVLRLAPEFLVRRQRIVGSYVSMINSGLQARWTLRRRTQEALRRLATIDTDVVTTHVVAFEDASSAYEMIDTRPEECLGVMLDYGQTNAC